MTGLALIVVVVEVICLMPVASRLILFIGVESIAKFSPWESTTINGYFGAARGARPSASCLLPLSLSLSQKKNHIVACPFQ